MPQSIVLDNGPEFAGCTLEAWAYAHQLTLCFIRPGKPIENAYIESFNGEFRDECLNEHWFVSLHARNYSFTHLDNYGVIARSFRLAGRALWRPRR